MRIEGVDLHTRPDGRSRIRSERVRSAPSRVSIGMFNKVTKAYCPGFIRPGREFRLCQAPPYPRRNAAAARLEPTRPVYCKVLQNGQAIALRSNHGYRSPRMSETWRSRPLPARSFRAA